MTTPLSQPVTIVVCQTPLGSYGDQGNARVLLQRLRWRGIDAEIVFTQPGGSVPEDGAIYLLGGGEGAALSAAVHSLRDDGGLGRAVGSGAVLFAVGAGYQLCGTTFTTGAAATAQEGLGLIDVTTRQGPKRAVGELLTLWQRPDGSDDVLTGFENHGNYTYLGHDASPLARVEVGVGNNGDGTEGAVSASGRVIGTYLHGPALARNPALADHLLTLALGRELGPLERANRAHEALREERVTFLRS